VISYSRRGYIQGRYTRRNGEPWTAEEDQVLRTCTDSTRAIAARLQRSSMAVLRRRQQLRLNGIRADDA
jgi:hypothetical protein